MDKIQFVVNTLAENYGFDGKEALEYVLNVQKEASPAYARAKKAIETTQGKIDVLQTKIDTRKVRNLDKANALMDELKAKLEEQQDRIDGVGKPKTRAKKAQPETVPEPAPAPAPEPEADEVKTKRISKLSKSFADKLGSLFQEMGSEMTDKSRKDFVKYANDLTRDDYVVKTMGEHMLDFIRMTLKPEVASDTIVTLELNDIIKLKHIVDGYAPGIFWDFANKRFITGPAETDEDAEDVEFNAMTYAVGTTTKRVYIPNDDGDVFEGFVGVGKFKDMEA
jgi:hypothetical protein